MKRIHKGKCYGDNLSNSFVVILLISWDILFQLFIRFSFTLFQGKYRPNSDQCGKTKATEEKVLQGKKEKSPMSRFAMKC